MKCLICDKLPHYNVKQAIKFQLKLSHKLNDKRPFCVYQCQCKKWLVSFKTAERYEMTNEYILDDVKWDDDKMVDREPEESTGRKHFGKLQMFILQVTKSFQAGNYVTIPGVEGGQFDDHDERGLKKFKGWTKGGQNRLYVLVATKKDKDGNSYQVVKQYKHKVQKDEPHLWADFVYPALNALAEVDRRKLFSGTPAEWEEVPTDHFAEIDGKRHEVKAWSNFKVHTAESLAKAESEFFSQFNTVDESTYPASWSGSVPDMLLEVARQLSEGIALDEIMSSTLLVENGAPVDGVDVKAVLLEGWKAIDQPEPLKAKIKAEIQALFEGPF